MTDVFISYARDDQATAQLVAAEVARLGYSVWWDDELPAHRNYGDVIAERIASARAMIVIWSRHAVASEWVRAEASRGREARKLIQAAIEPVAPPLPFDQLHVVSLADWRGEPDHPGWRRVRDSLAALAPMEARPPEAAPPPPLPPAQPAPPPLAGKPAPPPLAARIPAAAPASAAARGIGTPVILALLGALVLLAAVAIGMMAVPSQPTDQARKSPPAGASPANPPVAVGSALPDGWRRITSEGQTGDVVDIHMGTLRRNGSRVRVWQRTRFATPDPEGRTSRFGRWEFDCVARTSDLLAFQERGRDGQVMESGAVPAASRRRMPVVPRSVAEAVLNAVCAANVLSQIREETATGDGDARPESPPPQPAEPPASGRPQQAPGGLTIINRSGATMVALNVSPADGVGGSADLLAGRRVASGESVTVPIERATAQRAGMCLWNLRAVYEDGSMSDVPRANLCRTTRMTFAG